MFNIRKLVRHVHLWLGMSSGIVIFIVSITGCIYVFVDEIESYTKEEYFFIKAETSERLSLSRLKNIAESKMKNVRAVQIFTDRERTAIAYARGEDQEHDYRIYLNPYTGAVLGVIDMDKDFLNIIIEIHYSLLLGDIGSKIIGYSVLIFIVLLVSGIVLWWPRNSKKKRSHFKIKWDGKWRRKNYDLHSVLGFYASWIAIIIAITGLTWSFEWVKDGIYLLATGESKTVHDVASDVNYADSTFPADQALAYTMDNYPPGHRYYIVFPNSSTGTIYIYAYYKPDDLRARDSFYAHFDQYTGRILEEKVPGKRNRGDQLQAMNYDIHTGAIFGFTGKLIAFFTSLIIASLPVTGVVVWIGRLNKKPKGRKSLKEISTSRQDNPHQKVRVLG